MNYELLTTLILMVICWLVLTVADMAGVAALLGWCPSRYLFKQYRGLYADGGQMLYVNIGLGETIFPARTGTRPEITLITLEKQ